jgi:hypothetical protein
MYMYKPLAQRFPNKFRVERYSCSFWSKALTFLCTIHCPRQREINTVLYSGPRETPAKVWQSNLWLLSSYYGIQRTWYVHNFAKQLSLDTKLLLVSNWIKQGFPSNQSEYPHGHI